jgi:transposase
MSQLPSLGSSSSSSASLFAGIDVAKDKLDLARSDSVECRCFSNDPTGIAQIVDSFKTSQPVCIVVESTGGLERALLEALLDAALPVALVNPGRVRHFAIGAGFLAKTDRIDAAVLVQFAQRASVRLTQKCSENQRELDALITCRRQLVRSRAVQENCKSSAASTAAINALAAVIKTLDKQIQLLDRQIRKLIDSDDDFKHMDRLLRSVPGVGPVLSSTLLAELAELGASDRQHISALVGVAPFNHDSGQHRGKRTIRGGRVQVRNVLYMSSVCAIQHNPVLQRFAQRLSKAGKSSKVIIVACMRKLLALLNAMVRDNIPWHQLQVVKNLQTQP